MKRLLPLVLLAAALLAATAAAADRPTLADLEDEVICPTCETTLDQSNAPVANRMRDFIRRRIAAGDSKDEIKRKLEDEFGARVLAAPRAEGFGLLAWVLPLAGLGLGAVVVGALTWRWSRAREPAEDAGAPELNGRARLDPELERRVDEELARFD